MKVSELPNGRELAKFLRCLRKDAGVPWRIIPRICPPCERLDVDDAVSAAWRNGHNLGMMALHGANRIIGTHGVESVELGGRVYSYANAGDPYRTTLIVSSETYHPFVGNWGAIAERYA